MKNTDKKFTYPFFETIRMENGIVCAPERHRERMQQTCNETWGDFRHDAILKNLQVPEAYRTGIVKLNVFYNQTLFETKFSPYVPQEIKSIRLVDAPDELNYHLKYTDRSLMNKLVQLSGADEIIMVRNGMITDTSKANIVFEKEGAFFTPNTFLLNGTMRQHLLNTQQVKEAQISLENMAQYEAMYFVNAMNPLGLCKPQRLTNVIK